MDVNSTVEIDDDVEYVSSTPGICAAGPSQDAQKNEKKILTIPLVDILTSKKRTYTRKRPANAELKVKPKKKAKSQSVGEYTDCHQALPSLDVSKLWIYDFVCL